MLKRNRLVSLTLTSLTIGAVALAQTAARLPSDKRFDSPVTVSVNADGLPLDLYLKALGMAVKLNVITEGVPDRKVSYDYAGKPFRQAWELTTRLNNLDFELLPNDIVVVGPPDRIAAIRTPAPVATTPTATPAPTERRVYNVSGDATALAALLQKEVPGVNIGVLPGSKVLLITGTAAQHTDVGNILKAVDLAPIATPTATPQVAERRSYTVSSDPAALATLLEKEVPGVKVGFLPGSKVLLVTGTAAQHNDVNNVLKAVDSTPTPVVSTPTATPTPTERRAYNVSTDPAALATLLQKEVPGVNIGYLPGSNVLFVTGTAAQHADVATILKTVDVTPAAPATTTPQPAERRPYTVNGDPNAIKTLLEKQVPGVNVGVLAGSKVVLVTGTAAQQAEVGTILDAVDQPIPSIAGPTIVRQVFNLSNTKATKLADVLRQAVQGPTPTASNGTGSSTTTIVLPGTNQTAAAPAATSAANSVPVTITADETTNALIVSGPQDQVQQIAQLIPQLDKRQSLVNVGVRIQEVTDDVGRSLGIDWNFGFGNFAGKILGGGLNFLFDATSSLAGLNLGATLNALETQQLSRKINDSTITVVNNGTGTLNSGGRIEISIPSSSGTAGGINKTLEFGVIIKVSPQVAADGTITMNVNAEISDVANPNSVDPQRVDFSRQASDTTVILRDGQSLLLGSLLATKQDSKTDGLPVLSAIPLIGDLFKTTKVSSSQKQLLIILTVNVVK